MSREFPYIDKNSERRMLFFRCRQIKDTIGGKIFADCVRCGDFLFRDGQYKPDEIELGEWTPFGENDYWGAREQYCWFKQTVTVPESFKGKKIVYEITPFPDSDWDDAAQQFIIFVNGKMTQGIDSNHTFIFLTDKAEGGESFDIALSAYCDDRNYRGQTKLASYIKTYDEDAATLFYDLDTLLDAADNFDEDDLNRVDIIKAVNHAVNLLELSTPDKEAYHSSLREASAYLHREIFGKASPVTISSIGHTHIDTAYLWRLRQTRDKAGRSFATVLNLMKEYPEYLFADLFYIRLKKSEIYFNNPFFACDNIRANAKLKKECKRNGKEQQ